MTVTIAPFTVDSNYNLRIPPVEDERIKADDMPITYWGIFLDDEYVSFVSSKETAEKTKTWMEEWLKN